MSKVQVQSLAKHLKSIQRGSYWFGIVGRLTILWTLASFLLVAIVYATGGTTRVNADTIGVAVSPMNLFYGWLFLLGRDAFEAIAALIKEMDEVV